MQQANRLTGQPEPSARSLSGSVPGTSFVINLCSSTSPVALSPPDHAGLKRFTFFVSRRREEGRERFRLHMGYFQSQEEAEKLLDIVREIYPGAWAGLAPGQRLRAAAAAASSPPPAIPPPAEPGRATALEPVQQLVAQAPDQPVQQAAAPPAPAPVVVTAPVTVTVAVVDADLEDAVASPTTQPPAVRIGTRETSEHEAAARSLKDVRAAIASLEDTGLRVPVLQPAHSAQELNDEAAMALLEQGARSAGNDISAVVPAKTDTAKASTDHSPAAQRAVFAVQLMWSVQPIDIAQVPQLAIFGAYTLYGADGNREGRRWYGLRLGFFTDAVSAKQVAHYVRSEFSTVSVVPVTTREKERAQLASSRPNGVAVASAPTAAVTAAANKPAKAVPSADFEFIEDKPPDAAAAAKLAATRSALGPRTARGAPGKRAKLRNAAQAAAARAKPKKLTLEETLEILGAGDLKMDDGKTALINHTPAATNAAARPQPNKAKASRLGRLFVRLSERIGN